MVKIKKSVVVIAVPMLILSWSQGCSKVSFLNSGFASQKDSKDQSSDYAGNGGTYDGKLRVLHHYVDGFQCENRQAPESILISKNFDQGHWVLIQNSKEKCAVVDQKPVTGVVYDDVIKQAKFNGLTYVAPRPYLVDAFEDPSLPDVKPLDAVCEDINGKCSLLASLQTSEIASYTDSVDVTFPAATFKLWQELPLTSGPNGHLISIHGMGSNATTLDGQGATNILRLFGSATSGPVNLQGLTLQGGYTPYNFAPSGKSSSSALENNLPAQLNLVDVIFSKNVGADVFQTTKTGGSVSIQKSRFLNNTPGQWAIRFEYVPNGQLLLDEVEITNTSITTVGGAITATETPKGRIGVTLRNSLIRQTTGGCALYFHNVDEALVENTTIVNNQQQALTSVMDGSTTSGDLNFLNSTILDNGSMTPWGQSNFSINVKASSQVLNLKNTIVAQSDTALAVNCLLANQAATIATNSLINDATCAQSGSGNVSANPMLAPIANNGGFTETMLPLIGSSAIDAGDNVSCLPRDQRGYMRPVDKLGSGAKCDIGAAELQ
jgi:hypothetical protein